MSLTLTYPTNTMAAYSWTPALVLPEPGVGAILFTDRAQTDVHVARSDAAAWSVGWCSCPSTRARRQIDQSKPNKSWRVLHRVTYVERPALANFGQDHRPLTIHAPPQPSLEDQVAELRRSQELQDQRLQQIMQYLQTKLP
jgi:hypothetical protein